MQIGVVSDTHSHFSTISKVLEILSARGITLLIHCGDIEDAAAVRLFTGFKTHFVFGNCDHDCDNLREAMKAIGARLHEPYGDLEVDGKKIAWIHGDNQRLFRDVEHSGHYDYLFYGHTHRAEQHRTGPTLVVNPGALYRARPKSFIILNTVTGEIETVIPEQVD